MRRVAFVALMGCLLSWTAAASAQDRIPWVADWREAREIAQQQHRLVLLHFYTDDCLPCQKLERNVFPRAEVARALSTGYVPVKIDAKRFPQLRDHYKVVAWPTDIIVTAEGKEVARSVPSPADANGYIAMLDGARAQYGIGTHLTEQVAGHNPVVQPESGLPPSRYGTGGFGGSTAAPTNSGGYGEPQTSAYQPQTQAATPPPQSGYVTNQFAEGGLVQQPAAAQPANVMPRYGDRYAGTTAGQTEVASAAKPADSIYGPATPAAAPPQTSPAPYGQPAPSGYGQQAAGGYGQSAPTGYGQPAPGGYGDQYTASTSGGTNQFQGYQGQPQQPPTQQATNQPPAEPAASGESQFAMDGFCPVTLVDQGQWLRGDVRWGAVHEGKTYLFSSQQRQQQFLAAPGQYAPVLAGFDPVRYAETGQLVHGKREHGVFYGNRIYLFADEVALDRFSKHTEFYMDRVRQASATQPTRR